MLHESTGETAADFAETNLFEPTGMADSSMNSDASGGTQTFMGLQTTCLDLARFGYLALRHGTWDGKEVVSSDYVAQATSKSSTELNAAYGLLWWLNHKGPVLGTSAAMGGGGEEPKERLAPRAPDNAFWAIGAGRQMISILPDEGIVAVRMGAAPLDNDSITADSFTGDVIDSLR